MDFCKIDFNNNDNIINLKFQLINKNIVIQVYNNLQKN